LDLLLNPFRGGGLPATAGVAEGRVASDPDGVEALLRRCPVAATTPLRDATHLAARWGVARLQLKDERDRMGLGSFKALGAGHAVARMAAERIDRPGAPAAEAEMATALAGTVFACASAGNHGLSVAASARVFGAQAVVYLGTGVPEAFARRLHGYGAQVVRAGDDYEASMAAVQDDAAGNGWVLLSDSSWPGYVEVPTRVMEGYLAMGAEITAALDRVPTHVLLQAGVGGLAASLSALMRDRWGEEFGLVVAEPAAAPALIESIRAGRPVTTTGPASTMGRLDCKEPSHVALAELARSVDVFVTLEDDEVADTVEVLGRHGIPTTPSGAAGVAVLDHAREHRIELGLDERSRVLAIITEGPEDDA
jgi:diaminopropionate ammonia-lyase